MVTPQERLQAVRGFSRVLWDDRRQLRWVLRRRVDAAYLGWHGRGNLGDEAMFASAVRHSAVPLLPAPLHRASRAFASGVRIRTLVLGGGTLIGRDEWANRLEALLTRTHVERLVVLGTGCEDLSRALALGIATERGLRRWSSLLQNADLVGVRGPDSQKSLADLSVTSMVVGDLGLLADALVANRPLTSSAHPIPKRVGVNIAGVEDALGRDRQAQLRTMAKTVSALKERGFSPVFFSMEAEDDEAARRLADTAMVEMQPFRNNLDDMLTFLMGCSAVLSERLHGGILATALDVPNVLVGYKPKCLDFARSVGLEANLVSLEEQGSQELAERLIRTAESETPEVVRENLTERRAALLELIHGIGE